MSPLGPRVGGGIPLLSPPLGRLRFEHVGERAPCTSRVGEVFCKAGQARQFGVQAQRLLQQRDPVLEIGQAEPLHGLPLIEGDPPLQGRGDVLECLRPETLVHMGQERIGPVEWSHGEQQVLVQSHGLGACGTLWCVWLAAPKTLRMEFGVPSCPGESAQEVLPNFVRPAGHHVEADARIEPAEYCADGLVVIEARVRGNHGVEPSAKVCGQRDRPQRRSHETEGMRSTCATCEVVQPWRCVRCIGHGWQFDQPRADTGRSGFRRVKEQRGCVEWVSRHQTRHPSVFLPVFFDPSASAGVHQCVTTLTVLAREAGESTDVLCDGLRDLMLDRLTLVRLNFHRYRPCQIRGATGEA
nr:hypothetical protein [Variovorax boronicumulans]